jgi:hypothetical protein
MLKSIGTIVGVFTVLFVFGQTASSEKPEVTMDAIYVPVGRLVIAPPVGVAPKRSAVPFPHSGHFDYSCKSCHHQWDGHSPVRSCSASTCHDQTSFPVKTIGATAGRPAAIRYYKYAYHQQCIGCHREIKTRNQKLARSIKRIEEPLQATGPTGCLGCHPRE